MTTTSVLTSLDAFLVIAPRWESLARRCHFDSLCATHAWLTAWWRSFGQDDQLRVITISDGDTLLAAAPLRLGRTRFRGLPITQLAFLTNEHAPHMDCLVDKAFDGGYGALLDAANRITGWQVFYLENVPATSPLWQAWSPFLAKNRLLAGRKSGSLSPYLDTDRSFDDFYHGLTRNSRKALRKKLRLFDGDGRLQLEEITPATDERYIMENLFRVASRSWKARQRVDLTADPRVMRFFRELTAWARQQNRLRLWFLKRDDQVIAYKYHIEHGKTYYALVFDFDEAFREFQPGILLDVKIHQHVFGQGIKQYRMGGSNDYYKLRWTSTCHEHWRGFIFRPTLYTRLLYLWEFRLIHALGRSSTLRALQRRLGSSRGHAADEPRLRSEDER